MQILSTKTIQILYILISLHFFYDGNAQNNTDCLSKYQLFKMQSSNIEEIRFFLNNENWSFNGAKINQSYNYFDYPINYNIVSWEKSSYNNVGNIILYNSNGKPNIIIYQSNSTCFNSLLNSFSTAKGKTIVNQDKLVTIFKDNGITIEFREYKNDYSSRQYSILVYNSNALFQELQILKEKDEALKKLAIERNKKIANIIAEGDLLFSSNNFYDAKIKYATALDLENNSDVQSKINLCEKAICQALISQGDSLYTINKYDEAINAYSKAKECSEFQISLTEKIKIAQKKITEIKINNLQIEADRNFNSKYFSLALDKYKTILQLDKLNIYAINKVNKINEIINILEKRRTQTFSYRNTNQDDYLNLKKILLNDINNRVIQFNDGFLNLSYKINFDTSGNNISKIENLETSLKEYTQAIESIISTANLNPSNESGFFLASQERISFDVKWSTTKSIFNSNSKGIVQVKGFDQNSELIENYINRQATKFGKYTIETKSKEANGKRFFTKSLVDFKTVGPEAIFLSMILPGMGTLKVTHGEKGWGRFTLFLLSSSLSIGSKIYSNSQYEKYLSATNPTTIDKLYINANLSNKISLVSASISGSLYFYDILWVLSKGIKNIKRSSTLRNSLKKGPIVIQNDILTWE